jgi:predicted MPP superfamily phosphohydrolase
MMTQGNLFPLFRLIMMVAPALSQIYLFLRVRKAVLAFRCSRGARSLIVCLVAATMGFLLALNGYVLSGPVPRPDEPAALRAVLFYLPAIWSFGAVFSALFLCLVQAAGTLRRIFVHSFGKAAEQAASCDIDAGRRRFLKAGIAGVAAAPFILSGYGAAYAGKECEVRELSLPFGRTVRVVQLTDIHAGVYMTRKEIARYADRVAALQPDLFVITGDFISNSMAFLPGCIEELERVKARYGAFATLGNHERWYGKWIDLRPVFRRRGIRLLVNSHEVVRTEQGAFAIAGIDDLRTGRPSLTAALRGVDPAMPTLLLSHRPEIFPEAAGRGIPLTLAGHYHGGQIKVCGLSPAQLRTPYPEGLYRIDDCRLYVSCGIGTTFTPVRLNVPPEVTLLNLT